MRQVGYVINCGRGRKIWRFSSEGGMSARQRTKGQVLTHICFFFLFSFTSQDRPVDHWPNIVSILLDKVNELNSMEKIVFFFDNVSVI